MGVFTNLFPPILLSLLHMHTIYALPPRTHLSGTKARPYTLTNSIVSLANTHVAYDFDGETLVLSSVRVSETTGTPTRQVLAAPVTDLWQVEVVYGSRDVNVGNNAPAQKRTATQSRTDSGQQLLLQWQGVAVDQSAGLYLDVNVTLSLSEDGNLLQAVPSAAVGYGASLWSVAMRLGPVLLAGNGACISVPEGFGRLLYVDRNNYYDSQYGKDQGYNYPSVRVSYQAMAAYPCTGPDPHPNPSTNPPGLYFASHDPHGSLKAFNAWGLIANPQIGSDQKAGVGFNIRVLVEGAGRPETTSYTVPFSFAIAPFVGDWWDGAQPYRQWVLSNADWTKQGPVTSNSWLGDVNVWFNTGWQHHDVFNRTQGDPAVVLQRVTDVVERLRCNQTLPSLSTIGLHWYEWHEVLFDTMYPEYFPVRDGFKSTTQALQNMGVRVVPYINGRIHDIHTATWAADHAEQYTCGSLQAQYNGSDPTYYTETYGSGAYFAPMCPGTDHWQDKIESVADRLTGEYGVNGVYIDQVGSASPKACWRPNHGHSLGGGSYWTQGNRNMLMKAWNPGTELLTEDNSEVYMGAVQGMLSLVAMNTPMEGFSRLIGAYSAIYNGYFTPLGAMFYQSDTQGDADGLAGRLAVMFANGYQMGWFSLGGTNYAPPMGLYEWFMDSRSDNEVRYLRSLANFRFFGKDFLVHGRRMRELPVRVLNPNTNEWGPVPSVPTATYRRDMYTNTLSNATDGIPVVVSSAWIANDQSTLGFFFTTPVKSSGTVNFAVLVDLDLFGSNCKNSIKGCTVHVVSEDGERIEANGMLSANGEIVNITKSLDARRVLLVVVAHVVPPVR
eukprot:comp20961_c0_seq1/m.28046 comp20961_c0_seq1/g.28046  ORF comp20961_c0_seq1/g.28046 comp20961_c0_seq1/m.28046 type:complete len:835 (-) comp20961_c0_seq1:429-2933(-)